MFDLGVFEDWKNRPETFKQGLDKFGPIILSHWHVEYDSDARTFPTTTDLIVLVAASKQILHYVTRRKTNTRIIGLFFISQDSHGIDFTVEGKL